MWIEVHNNGASPVSMHLQCVVLPDLVKALINHWPLRVSMHLQVRGAP